MSWTDEDGFWGELDKKTRAKIRRKIRYKISRCLKILDIDIDSRKIHVDLIEDIITGCEIIIQSDDFITIIIRPDSLKYLFDFDLPHEISHIYLYKLGFPIIGGISYKEKYPDEDQRDSMRAIGEYYTNEITRKYLDCYWPDPWGEPTKKLPKLPDNKFTIREIELIEQIAKRYNYKEIERPFNSKES